MKNLDGVIKSFEMCKNGTCEGCPSAVKLGHNDYRCSESHIDGALEHLKAYREMLDNVENEPLDFEEIVKMRSKPIWVEIGDCKIWLLVRGYNLQIKKLYHLIATDGYGFEYVFTKNDIEKGKVKVYKKECKEMKPKYEEPPLEKKVQSLDFYDLATMIGKPVFVVSQVIDRANWEILTGVKRTFEGYYVEIKGSEDNWIDLKNVKIYRTEEGAKQSNE